MTSDLGRPTRILAAMDAGEGRIALDSALALAERHGAALEVIACVDPPQDLAIIARIAGRDPDKLIEEAVERTREEVRAKLSEAAPERAIEPRVAVGKAYLEIIRHAAKTDCDFVIKQAEPLSGIHRFLFASTDQHLLRKCPCPVWLQTPTAPITPRRVLAAVDLDVWDAAEPETLTSLNARVVAAARCIAAASDAEVVVLHAWEAIGEGMIWAFSSDRDARMSADRYVDEIRDAREDAMSLLLAKAREEGGSDPRLVPRLARGAPEMVIEEQSRELGADVVVMGTVARTGLSGVFIGNTAENIINNLERPVLAVKPEGFVSPLLRGP